MNLSDTSSPVFVTIEGAIGFIKLNRAERRNALSEAMWATIPAAVEKLEAIADVRVIIFTSSDDTVFSAGADIGELEKISADPVRRESNRLAIRNAQRSLARATKPTIAQIWGPCMGGGCGLALHCDFRFAATGARFGITPAKLGIIYPLSDTKRLIDTVGVSHAKSLLFTAQTINAERALEIGLVDRLYSQEDLAKETIAFAVQISTVSQFSVREMKVNIQRILDGQTDDDEVTAEMFKKAQEGDDAREGVRAFLEKRPPSFRWSGYD